MPDADERPADDPAGPEPAGPEPAGPARTEADGEGSSGGGILKQNIAVTLASLIVLAAGLAIMQVRASANESNTARETTRVAVRAMRANVVADTVAGLQPELQAERDFLPFRRPLTPGAPTLAEAAGIPSPPSATAGSLRVAQQTVPDLGVGSLLPRLESEAQRLTLQQRALATTRITWNDRSTQYTTVIAVLAVAIFLVGYGLVVDGPIRPAAYAIGLGVGLFAAAWAVWIYHRPIPSTPLRAIQATARGSTLTAEGDYAAAISAYDNALKADGGYATAYSGRARARLLAANPDYAVTRAVSNVTGPKTAAGVEDADRASQLDSRDILSATILALMSFYRGGYDRAADAVAAARAINPKVPDLWMLASAIDLARGDRETAAAELGRALAQLRAAGPSQQTRLVAASYLSYLAWIERHAPGRAAAARQLAQRLVAAETALTLGSALPARPPRTGGVSIRGLAYRNGKLRLTLGWHDLPAGTALSGIAYERPLASGAWTQAPDLALFATVAGSGKRVISVPLERTCKPTAVRVDVYLNGKPTLTRTGPGVAATC